MRIEVTQEDIDDGIQGQCFVCPIALAVTRTLRTNKFVESTICSVSYYSLWIDHRPYPLPLEAQEFIHNFDSGSPVKPF